MSSMQQQELAQTGDRWGERPRIALAIRVVAFAAPIGISVLFVAVVSRVLGRPPTLIATVAWWILLTIAATVVLALAERLMRRLMPLQAMFRMSLAFPDQAPSRFKVAMKTNTLRQLQRNMAAGQLPHGTAGFQEAAENLLALATALNSHDRMTRGHTERVRAYTLMIGEEMRLSRSDLDRLHWAGLVHDIGKLEVPPELLNKKGAPTAEEWEVIKGHPLAGRRLVEPLRPWLGDWADAASQHHERVDGKGYPDGLRGYEISLAGKIVAVADAFDVMTSVRSYKQAMTPDAARAELTRCAGTQFDADVVRAFLGISVGRLRLVMGPLSWLAQVIGSGPFGATASTLASAAVSMAVALTSGLVSHGPATPPPPPKAVVARPAVAVPIRVSGLEDTDLVVDALPGLSPRPTSWKVLTVPAHLRMADPGPKVRLVPDRNYAGDTDGRYEACWGQRCSRSTLQVSIRPVDDAPVLEVDRLTMLEDHVALVDPIANDSDVEDAKPTLRSVAPTARLEPAAGSPVSGGGSVDLQPWGQVRFAPPSDFFGTARISYTARDTDRAETTGEIVIVVEPENDVPVAEPDRAVVAAGATATVNVLANDSDVDDDPLRIVTTSTPAFGRLTSDGERLTFTAPAGPARSQVITYVAEDPDGARATAEVTLSVLTGVSPPEATDDTFTVAEDAPAALLRILDNDRHPNGALSEHTVRVVRRPRLGTATVDGQDLLYQPAPDASGADLVGYEVCDPTGLCDTATAAVRVTPVNDAPSFALKGDGTVAEDAGPTTIVGFADRISVGPDNERGQAVSFSTATSRPSLFSTQPEVAPDGTLSFEPSPDVSGSATVTVTATDSGGGSDTSAPQIATITVTAVNDRPSFSAGPDVSVAEDSGPASVAGWASGLSVGPADESGQTVTYSTVADQPALFAVQPSVAPDGTLSFEPAPNARGSAAITVTATDSGGGTDTSTPETATITVTSVNDPVVAVADGVTVAEDEPGGVTFDVVGNDIDIDGDPITVTGFDTSATVGGTVTEVGGGSFTYLPNPDFVGPDSFTYSVTDGSGSTSTAIVIVFVSSVNDRPSFSAGPDVSVAEDSGPASLAGWASGLSVGPPDESGQTVTYSTTADRPALFAVQPAVAPDGTLTFRPAVNAYGSTTITVIATDSGGGTDTSTPETATIMVTSVNDPVVAVADGVTVAEDEPGGVTFDVVGNDTDADGDPISVTGFDISATVGGTVTDAGGGYFTYVPNPDYSGNDSFTYTVTDGNGSSATTTVAIIVTPRADAPVAEDDAYTSLENVALTIAPPGLLANDFDEDGDPLSVSTAVVLGPTNGSVFLFSSGAFVYMPSLGFKGTDSFAYRVNDGTGRSAIGTVTVTVDSGLTPRAFYLGTTLSGGSWGMLTAPLPVSNPEPDHDSDGARGFTLKAGDGSPFNVKPRENLHFTYDVTSALDLDGPVALQLWSTAKDFDDDDAAHPVAYLYDCTTAGTGCVPLAATDVHLDPYNRGIADWVPVKISLGNVTHSFPVGRQLRIRVQVLHQDLWVAASGARPSRLDVTVASP